MNGEEFIENYMKPLNEKLSTENKKTFIAGDFNFDLSRATHKESFDFFETMMTSFQMPVISLPTKINPKRHTIIDNIFVNEIHPQMKSGNLSLAISDHLPSFFYVPKDNQNHLPKKHNTYTRSTKNFNRENFISEFKDIHWNTILRPDENNTNLSMERFMT